MTTKIFGPLKTVEGLGKNATISASPIQYKNIIIAISKRI